MKYVVAFTYLVFSSMLSAEVLKNVCEHDYSKKIFYTSEELVNEKEVISALDRIKMFYTKGTEYRENLTNALNMAHDKRLIEAYEYKLQIIDGVKRGYEVGPEIREQYCKILNMKASNRGS